MLQIQFTSSCASSPSMKIAACQLLKTNLSSCSTVLLKLHLIYVTNSPPLLWLKVKTKQSSTTFNPLLTSTMLPTWPRLTRRCMMPDVLSLSWRLTSVELINLEKIALNSRMIFTTSSRLKSVKIGRRSSTILSTMMTFDPHTTVQMTWKQISILLTTFT